MIALAILAIATCLPIDAARDQITAGDLARALPEWSAVEPETGVALAPVPGIVRTLRASQLRILAERFSLHSEPSDDLCFQRPVATVPASRMLEIMQDRLPGARIEILEASRVPAPNGVLDFPLSGLRPGYWYGSVAFGAGHRFTVWARIRASVPLKRIVASADLRTGQPIEPGQLRIEIRDEFPVPGTVDTASPGDLTGFIPLRSIRAGAIVQKQWLAAPQLVKKGDTVKVEVVSGAAKLEAQGIAQSSGALGDTISVLNPDSKRRFRARVESATRVSVKGSL